jgi:hypothetical protein
LTAALDILDRLRAASPKAIFPPRCSLSSMKVLLWPPTAQAAPVRNSRSSHEELRRAPPARLQNSFMWLAIGQPHAENSNASHFAKLSAPVL